MNRVTKSLTTIPGVEAISFIEVQRPSNQLLRLLDRNVERYIVNHADGYDIIQCHNVWDPATRAGLAGARTAKVPCVLTPHGSLDPWAMKQSLPKMVKKKVALALQLRSLIDGALFIHTLNEDERRGIQELNFKAHMNVIPNGIYASEFEALPPPGAFRTEFSQIGARPFVLFLSRLHFKKGLDYLAKGFQYAHARNQDLQLVVAGPDEGEKAAFLQAIQRAGISASVHLVGPIYGPMKYAALVDADVFCLPSRMEGFSIAILEALACGCPVVISKQCNFPEVGACEAGIVTDLDAKEIGESILRLTSDGSLRDSVIANGRSLVRDNYTWPIIARTLRDAYIRRMESLQQKLT